MNKAAEIGLDKVIFDVGGNDGRWSTAMNLVCPLAEIHTFEICPPTFEKLLKKLGDNDKITINDFGLGDENGSITVNYCSEQDGLSSTVAVVCSDNTSQIEAQIKVGQEYCVEKEINTIDFLKIDVEGGEPGVLKGFKEMLNPSKIPLIQFEYGMVCIESKFLLKDFYELLTARGYVVGKLFPDHVKFKDYEYTDENFLGPNYVAASPQLKKDLSYKD